MQTVQMIEVMTASPSDVTEDRDTVERTIHRWNSLHATSGAIYLPRRWEKDAYAEMGGSAQAVVNDQVAERSDVLFGIFWTRLGTPTDDAESGSVQEIEDAIEAGKPVHLYFKEAPVPPQMISTDQLEKLRAYKESLAERGLLGSYFTQEELAEKVYGNLMKNAARFDIEPAAAGEGTASDVIAEVRTRRRRDGKGDSHYLVLRNRGAGDASDVDFEWVADDVENRRVPSVLTNGSTAITSLVGGTECDYPMSVHMGTMRQIEIHLTWTDVATSNPRDRTMTLTI